MSLRSLTSFAGACLAVSCAPGLAATVGEWAGFESRFGPARGVAEAQDWGAFGLGGGLPVRFKVGFTTPDASLLVGSAALDWGTSDASAALPVLGFFHAAHTAPIDLDGVAAAIGAALTVGAPIEAEADESAGDGQLPSKLAVTPGSFDDLSATVAPVPLPGAAAMAAVGLALTSRRRARSL